MVTKDRGQDLEQCTDTIVHKGPIHLLTYSFTYRFTYFLTHLLSY